MSIIERRGGVETVLRHDVPAISRVIEIVVELASIETCQLVDKAADLFAEYSHDKAEAFYESAEIVTGEREVLVLLQEMKATLINACAALAMEKVA